MVVALTRSTQDEEKLQLEINISTTLGITATQARRKLTRFLMDEVSLLITPQSPLLVVNDQNNIFWRFPLVLAMGHHGQPGQVGEVDVNAYSGDLLITDELLENIKANAQRLVRSTTHSAIG
ncbi:MAG: hypothetical protein L0322_01070 [Chloroflexi bacterium]|nr:hypothetical protein [Chloroflexota bacterium]MCI0580853.1 hypothetical protein [Chloroflexota bacterium]MCI0649489.1 hypothetical protein [Chloroflexota bacterium]